MKFSFLFLVCLPFCLFAETPFEQALSFYDQGDYQEALSSFRSIEGSSAALDFNVANTLMRLDRVPEALASYRRALWQNPGDPDVRANLQTALDQLAIEHPALPISRRITGFFSARQWQLSFIIGCWAFAGFGTLIRWIKPLRSTAVWVFPLVSALLAFSAFGVWASLPSQFEREAIVLGGSVVARFSPLSDATEHFSLPQGALVNSQEKTRNWLRVEVDQKKGWVLEGDLIRLSKLQ